MALGLFAEHPLAMVRLQLLLHFASRSITLTDAGLGTKLQE